MAASEALTCNSTNCRKFVNNAWFLENYSPENERLHLAFMNAVMSFFMFPNIFDIENSIMIHVIRIHNFLWSY